MGVPEIPTKHGYDSHFGSTLQCPSASACDWPIYFFLKITQLVHFSDILSRMILENWTSQDKRRMHVASYKSLFNFPATSKRYAQQNPAANNGQHARGKRWRRSSTCSKSKGWKFPSRPLTNARSAESGMCLRIRSKLLSRWCWAKETASLWISWISSFAAKPKAPCTHCARTWGNKVAINVPKSWSKKADSKIDEIWAQLELRGCELNVCFFKGNACLGGKATNKANRQRRNTKKLSISRTWSRCRRSRCVKRAWTEWWQ